MDISGNATEGTKTLHTNLATKWRLSEFLAIKLKVFSTLTDCREKESLNVVTKFKLS